MTIDFENADNRKAYLTKKMDDLLTGINESYSTILMDELIARLEKTVSEFNQEVTELMEYLKARTERKEELLEKIKLGEAEKVEATAGTTERESEPERERSVWEKKLEAMDKS